MTPHEFVDQCIDHPGLKQRVLDVLLRMPAEVRRDLLHDHRFSLVVYDPRDGETRFQMAAPGVGDSGSRLVALKASLAAAPADFAAYVIAHEFAHAYLRNRGRTAAEDPEDGADALAAAWGFPKPASARRFTWWRRQ